LLAGAVIPFIDGKPKKIKGTTFCDGGFAYPDLKLAAAELNCTHLFVLSTHPHQTEVASRYDNFSGNTYSRILGTRYGNLERFWQAQIHLATHLKMTDRLTTRRVKSHYAAVKRASHRVGTFSTDQWIIIDGSRKGYETVIKLFIKEATIGLVPEIL
jgi:predicted patatin/cPLA2 family phospholipase